MTDRQSERIEVLVTSPPDRVGLVAELWVGAAQLAELRYEGDDFRLEIYPPAERAAWDLAADDLLDGLQRARQELSKVDGREPDG